MKYSSKPKPSPYAQQKFKLVLLREESWNHIGMLFAIVFAVALIVHGGSGVWWGNYYYYSSFSGILQPKQVTW